MVRRILLIAIVFGVFGITGIVEANNINHQPLSQKFYTVRGTMEVARVYRVQDCVATDSTNTPPQLPCVIHIAQKGDNLFRIAKQYGFAPGEINAIITIPQNKYLTNRLLPKNLLRRSSRHLDWIFPGDIITLPLIKKEKLEIADLKRGAAELETKTIIQNIRIKELETSLWWRDLWLVLVPILTIAFLSCLYLFTTLSKRKRGQQNDIHGTGSD